LLVVDRSSHISVLWKDALLASEQRDWMQRMSVVLLREVEDWQILLAQVTPVLGYHLTY
jgi:hypothetical protein